MYYGENVHIINVQDEVYTLDKQEHKMYLNVRKNSLKKGGNKDKQEHKMYLNM